MSGLNSFELPRTHLNCLVALYIYLKKLLSNVLLFLIFTLHSFRKYIYAKLYKSMYVFSTLIQEGKCTRRLKSQVRITKVRYFKSCLRI